MTQASEYQLLTSKLFPDRWPGRQKIVPFLGAGASAPLPITPVGEATAFPDRSVIERVLAALHIPSELPADGGSDAATRTRTRRERLIIQFALALGYLMIERSRRVSTAEESIVQQLISEPYPPSAGRLVEFFASAYKTVPQEVSSLMKAWPEDWDDPRDKDKQDEWIQELRQTFRLLIDAASLWKAQETLTSIAASYEDDFGRQQLWAELHRIFKDKRITTRTHQFVARAARNHLALAAAAIAEADARNEDLTGLVLRAHYLIVTTNYDCLMEEALEDLPWMVLYFQRSQMSANDPQVSIRLSPSLAKMHGALMRRHQGKSAKEFDLDVDKPIVVIFKIHGSLHPDNTAEEDSVVITDFDYEEYVAEMGKGGQLVVPAAAGGLMHNRSFLFLGYSLADWNIRTILTTLIKRRAKDEGTKDYAVMKEVSTSAKAYCNRQKINPLVMSLDAFYDEVDRHPRDNRATVGS
jgi:hypothetical protein